jgi:hypothetical protein
MKVKHTILAAIGIIGVSTFLFQGLVQGVTAADFNKLNTIPTSYSNVVTPASQTTQDGSPVGYKKANYTVKSMNNQKPSSKDMKKEEAAEIAAQGLWEMFGQSLEGKVVEMAYQKPDEILPRAKWYGEVKINDKLNYFFYIDAVTGEFFSINRERWYDEKISDYDEALAMKPQEYVAAAKTYAEKFKVVHSPVKAAEYQAQSMGANNDPIIQVLITGENGEFADMYIARKDKAFLGVTYHTEIKYRNQHSQNVMEQHPVIIKGKK